LGTRLSRELIDEQTVEEKLGNVEDELRAAGRFQNFAAQPKRPFARSLWAYIPGGPVMVALIFEFIARLLKLERRQKRLEKKQMATQQEVDDLTAEVQQTKADFDGFKSSVSAKIDALNERIAELESGNPGVDDLKADVDSAQV
jgi:multidrug resistance efflux pump